MSQQTIQLVEIALIALICALAVLRLARRQQLSFRYAVGWLSLAAVALLAGLFIPIVGPIADWLRIEEFTLVAAVAVILLLVVCVQLSISISGLQRQVQRLAEEIAILRARSMTDADD